MAGELTLSLNKVKDLDLNDQSKNILSNIGEVFSKAIKKGSEKLSFPNGLKEQVKEGFEKIETYPQLNMGDPKTLSDFLTYSYKNYPASGYNLILYDHGGAIEGAIYDDFTGDNLSLDDSMVKSSMA